MRLSISLGNKSGDDNSVRDIAVIGDVGWLLWIWVFRFQILLVVWDIMSMWIVRTMDVWAN